jgi:hypothetical protein
MKSTKITKLRKIASQKVTKSSSFSGNPLVDEEDREIRRLERLLGVGKGEINCAPPVWETVVTRI